MGVRFPTHDDYLVLSGTNVPNGNAPVTAMIWYRPDTVDTANIICCTLSTNDHSWDLSNDSTGDVNVGLLGGGSGSASGLIVRTQRWHCLAATIGSNFGSLTSMIYLDGKLFLRTSSRTQTGQTPNELTIGHASFGGFSPVGTVAHCKIWNRELSPEEVMLESDSFEPVNTKQLFDYWSLSTTRDLRGLFARTLFTLGGSPVTGDSPPGVYTEFVLPSAPPPGGNSYNQTLSDSTTVSDITVGTTKAKGIILTESITLVNPAVTTPISHQVILSDVLNIPSTEVSQLGHVTNLTTESISVTDKTVSAVKNRQWTQTLVDSLNVLDLLMGSQLTHVGAKAITLVEALNILDTGFPVSNQQSKKYNAALFESTQLIDVAVGVQHNITNFILPAPNTCADLIDVTEDQNTGITPGNLVTVPPILGGGPMSQDLSISLSLSGGGGGVVGTGRIINTVLPLTGGASLGTDLTLGVNLFTSGTSGIVPASGGGTVNFLRADGTWQPGTVSGVPSTRLINTTPPLQGGGDLSADRTLSIAVFTSTTNGAVPASGGGQVNFLRADGAWAALGTGTFVSLQTTTPGTADVGNVHITGASLADTKVGVGTTNVLTRLHVVSGLSLGNSPDFASGSSPSLFLTAYHGQPGTQLPTWMWRRSRGTEASPTATLDGDLIGSIAVSGTTTEPSYTSVECIRAVADGNSTASDQPFYLDYVAGSASTITQTRQSQGGLIVSPVALTSDRAGSTLDLRGSIGLKLQSKTGNYTLTSTDTIINADATSGLFTLTLPAPTTSGITGRIYMVRKIDTTNNLVKFAVTGGLAQIDGNFNYQLAGFNDSVMFYSDGVQWRIVACNRPDNYFTQIATSSAVANTGSRTALGPIAQVPVSTNYVYNAGTVFRYRAGGFYSTTGTPTLRIQMTTNAGTNNMADSTAVTTASGVATGEWEIEGQVALQTSTIPRWAGGSLMLGTTAGAISVFATRPSSFPGTYGTDWQTFVTWGTASPSNTITQEYFEIEILDRGLTG